MNYDEDSIQILKGLDPIRRRPGMYVGGTDAAAMHFLLWTLVGDMVEEREADHSTFVRVRTDGTWIEIDNDGDGIPIEPVSYYDGRPAIEVLFTTLSGRRLSWPVASALSSRLEVDVWRDGRHYRMRFSRGHALGPLEDLGSTRRRGTRVAFAPDFDIFDRAVWNRDWIARRLCEESALHPQLTAIANGATFVSPNGIVDLVRHRARDAVHAPIHITGQHGEISVELAVAWTRARDWDVFGAVGPWRAPRGDHFDGFSDALFAAISAFDPPRFAGAHRDAFSEVIDPGVVIALRVEVPQPRLGSNRECLMDSNACEAVAAVVTAPLHHAIASTPALYAHLFARFPR